jgi:hypothetical protein
MAPIYKCAGDAHCATAQLRIYMDRLAFSFFFQQIDNTTSWPVRPSELFRLDKRFHEYRGMISK